MARCSGHGRRVPGAAAARPRRATRSRSRWSFAVAALELLDLHLERIADAQLSLAIALLELDRGVVDAGDLADERRDVREISAGLAGKDRAERLGLLPLRARVEVEGHLPAALCHLLRRSHG